MTDITVIILTRDEDVHIKRAIASVKSFATRVLVVDSGSTDRTVPLARAAGAEVLCHPWTNHAVQFNWALDQIEGRDTWVLRLDADEIASSQLEDLIAEGLPDVAGLYLRRRIRFQGRLVRFGGVARLPTMRLFRNGSGRAEARWMDEHISVEGRTAMLDAEIVDDNLRPLDWWTAKHNAYASREVADLVLRHGGSARHGLKPWIRDHVYARLPVGVRAGVYFLYRYILRGGCLDRGAARRFHVLQGFWYRYLVDAKLAEVRACIERTGVRPEVALQNVLGLRVPQSDRSGT